MKNLGSAMLIAICLLFCAISQAQLSQNYLEISDSTLKLKHDYTVKIVAGTQQDKHYDEFGRGIYSSIVNIYNPNPGPVYIIKELVLTNPLQDDGKSTIIPIGNDIIESNHAIKVNPFDYADSLTSINFIEGFLTIRSSGEIDVSTIYSASKFGANKIVALDIENIIDIDKPAEHIESPRLADLIPVPFMDGNYLHFLPKGLANPGPHGQNHYTMKIRNVGTKSCGPFEVKIYRYNMGAPVPMHTGWLSGLDIDEEKVLTIFLPQNISAQLYKIEVDINNLIEELSEENNTADSGITNVTW